MRFSIISVATVFLALVAATPSAAQQDGGAPGPSGISEEEAAAVVAQAMRERGLTPPPGSALSLEDYLSTREGGATRHVSLWVGPEGHIIPSQEWRDAHPDYCEGKGRYMKGAAKLVNFKLSRVPGGHYAFMQLIDVETGLIEGQREGQGSGGAGGLADALDDAWHGGGANPLTEPCGRKIEEDDPASDPETPPVIEPGTAYFSSTGEVEMKTEDAMWSIMQITSGRTAMYSLILISMPDYAVTLRFPVGARAGDTFSLTSPSNRDRPHISFSYDPPGGAFSDTGGGHQGFYKDGVSGRLKITDRTRSTISGTFTFEAHDTDGDTGAVYSVEVEGRFYKVDLPAGEEVDVGNVGK